MTKTKKKMPIFKKTEFFNDRFSPLLFVLYIALTLFIYKPGFLLEMDSPFYASFANICKYLSETSFLKHSSVVRINRYAFAICSLCWDFGIKSGTIFAYSHEFARVSLILSTVQNIVSGKNINFLPEVNAEILCSLPKVSRTLF